MTIITTEAISPEQIQEWKKEYKGRVFGVSVAPEEEGGETLVGWFRKPTLEELALASESTNKVTASLIVYNTCFLGGHPDFKDDEDVRMAAIGQFQTQMKRRVAEVLKP